jgi:hypothetical protein
MLGRRGVLRGLVAGGVLLCPLRLGLDARARASSAAPTDNLLLIDWPFGLPPIWTPEGTGANYTLGVAGPGADPYGNAPVLSSLVDSYRSELLILSGMRGLVEDELYIHAHGPVSMWTGASTANLGLTDPSPVPSIDQLVAERICAGLPIRSLHAGTLVGASELAEASVYEPFYHFFGAQGIPSIDDPGELLALVHAAGQQAAGSQCNAERAYVGLTGADSHNPSSGRSLTLAQAETIALAFQCGLTRVATLQLGHPDCAYTVPYAGATAPLNLAAHNQGDENDPVTRWVSARYMMDRITDVLDVLRSVGVLDQTLVVVSSEMGGSESDRNKPILILGGGSNGGAFRFKTGQHIALPDDYRITKLLVTILQYFGFAEETVGTFRGPGNYRGALPEVIA